MPEFTAVSHTLELYDDLEYPKDIDETAKQQGEDPDKMCELMQELKDMIYEKGDCNPHRMDDEFLIKFLRARFWKVETAYKLVN
jgi:CRAL/TRIO, N-terminal domain